MVSRVIAIIFVFSAFALSAYNAAAQEDQINVCAAVFPCDAKGNVFPEFSTGACAQTYKRMCARIKPQPSNSASSLDICMSSNAELIKMNRSKSAEIKRLKAQIRAQRSLAR